MKTYVALLRGINVSGQKKIKMDDLRQALDKAGLKKVRTYIQSGNIVFESKEGDKTVLQKIIYQCILANFGFEVPTLVTTGEDLYEILNSNPFLGKTDENRQYYVLLKQFPPKNLIQEFNKETFVNEEFHITGNCVYLCCKKGYGNAKLNNNLIERKLKVEATTRNLKTLNKLIGMVKET